MTDVDVLIWPLWWVYNGRKLEFTSVLQYTSTLSVTIHSNNGHTSLYTLVQYACIGDAQISKPTSTQAYMHTIYKLHRYAEICVKAITPPSMFTVCEASRNHHP